MAAKSKPAEKPKRTPEEETRRLRKADAVLSRANEPAPIWDGSGAKGTKRDGKFEVEIPKVEGKSREQLMAEFSLSPVGRHALNAKGLASCSMGDAAPYVECMQVIADSCGRVRAGNLDDLTHMLTAQAYALDVTFSEMTRRAMVNLGHFPEAVETYMRLALKAQANCRVTVETLAKVKRGGKQHIQITHVHKGGQAVVANSVTNNPREQGASDVEEYEQAAESAAVAALSGPDSEVGNSLPVSGYEGQDKVPVARRGSGVGSAEGK